MPVYVVPAIIMKNHECEKNSDGTGRPIHLFPLAITLSGVIAGYFYTRIYLPNLFSIMEENRRQKAEIALWKEEVRKKETPLCNHPNSEDKQVNVPPPDAEVQ